MSEIESGRRTFGRRDHRGEGRPASADLSIVCSRRDMDVPLRRDVKGEQDWGDGDALEESCDGQNDDGPRPL